MSTIISDQRGRPISAIVSIVLTVITVGYFLPWMIAALRGKADSWGVFWVNLLLGWTVIGWIAAFVMSVLPHRVAVVR